MSSNLINKTQPFMIADGGTVRSVNILFYDPSRGYVLCTEERKGFPDINIRNLQSHILGGKVDMTDKFPFESGVREFCEELPYVFPGYSIKETILLLLEAFEPATKRYKDFLVSKQKNLYNRFYIVNLTEISDDEIRESLYSSIDNWKPSSTGDSSFVKSLFFWKPNDTLDVSATSLLEIFTANKPDEALNMKNPFSRERIL